MESIDVQNHSKSLSFYCNAEEWLFITPGAAAFKLENMLGDRVSSNVLPRVPCLELVSWGKKKFIAMYAVSSWIYLLSFSCLLICALSRRISHAEKKKKPFTTLSIWIRQVKYQYSIFASLQAIGLKGGLNSIAPLQSSLL